MVTVDFQQVLTAAQQLPKRSQLKLVSALLKNAALPPTPLEPLSGLSEAELRALVDSVLAPRRAKRLKQLLRFNREKKLTSTMRAELEALLEESDRVALLKAKAKYTLSLYAH
jgi:hypothetical protein